MSKVLLGGLKSAEKRPDGRIMIFARSPLDQETARRLGRWLLANTEDEPLLEGPQDAMRQ